MTFQTKQNHIFFRIASALAEKFDMMNSVRIVGRRVADPAFKSVSL